MSEKPPENGTFRVIEGGKKDLREHGRQRTEATSWDNNIATVRKFSPSLDQYLRQQPVDRIDRMILLERVRNELWALPLGGADPQSAALQRNEEKHGKRPYTPNAGWRDATDEQIAWDEAFIMEYANAIAEIKTAVEEQDQKLWGLEDHLEDEAAKAYRDDDEPEP
jgi:hypothetical protein